MATETQAAGGAAGQTLEGGSLLDEILAETKFNPADASYDVAKKGVQAFITELLAPNRAQRLAGHAESDIPDVRARVTTTWERLCQLDGAAALRLAMEM